jgi:FAD/FMN-containing dehydrogenase
VNNSTVTRRRFLANGLALTSTILVGGTAVHGKEFLASKAAGSSVDFSALRKDIKGTVVTAADPEFKKFAYDTLWNRLRPSNRLPQVIVRVANDQDAITAVKFAKANGLKVVVRGGGHNWCVPSLRKGGMMVDLTNLTKVLSIDTEKRIAVTEPIVSNREIMKALNAKGFSYPTGHCPPVKMSGYLLSGGMAWNQGVWGPGVGSVEAIELVTPDGELIKATREEHEDYFWAARGAGCGFFGIALRYHLKLYPTPKNIAGNVYYFPLDQVGPLGGWLSSLAPKLSPKIELSLFVVTAPANLAEKCKKDNGKIAMVTATVFAESEEEVRTKLKPFDDCPVIDKCLEKSIHTPLTFEQLFDSSGELWPGDMRNQVDAIFSMANLKDMMEATKEHCLTMSPQSVFMFAIFTGPAVPVKPAADAAFSMTGKLYGGPWTMWKDVKDDAANIKWHLKCVELMKPYISGHYVSETDTVQFPDYAKNSFSTKNWAKIAELRKKYDPHGIFFAYFDGLN